MRKIIICLLVLLLVMSIAASAVSAWVWSPPPGPIFSKPTPTTTGWGSDLSIRIPAFTPPILPDWVLPLPDSTIRPTEIKMTLSGAERNALNNMEAGQCIPIFFVLPEEYDGQMLYWSSNNENVAVAITSVLIDPLGRRARICCITSGTALITVKTEDESFFYQFSVTVK